MNQPPDRPDLRTAVVLVEFRSAGLAAARATDALRRGQSVVIADNSETYEGPGQVVRTGGNVGFGAGCNAAVRALGPEVDVLVLQNPDAEIEASGLADLVDLVRTHGWTAVAPALVDGVRRPSGFAVPGPAREPISVALDCLEARLGRRPARPRRPDLLEPSTAGTSVATHLPGRFASAALLVVARQAFERVGGFDERYFLYVEDLDLWQRLERIGRVGFVPAVVATHRSGTGSDAAASDRTMLRWLGREQYADAQGRGWRAARVLHRMGSRLLPRSDGRLGALLRSGFRTWSRPGDLQHEVRRLELASGAGGTPGTTIRVGWSRTRVGVAGADRVLDVGSGAFPNPRADVLCERSLVRDHRIAVTDRPTVVADAQALPFRRSAFDLVIASHLAEHVEHPDQLLAELRRVARRGYVETPSPRFERLLPSENHRWTVRRRGSSHIEFTPNDPTRRDGLRRMGERLRPWYYAGTASGRNGGGLVGRGVARLAFLLRGTLNRAGVTVTRVQFREGDELRVTVGDQMIGAERRSQGPPSA